MKRTIVVVALATSMMMSNGEEIDPLPCNAGNHVITAPKFTPNKYPLGRPVEPTQPKWYEQGSGVHILTQAEIEARKPKKRTYQALSEEQAKEQIANRESGGDYNAVSSSGKYIGKYQLDNSYLNGDHSIENQERVANEYVASRYGSWNNALAHQRQYGWY